MSESVTGLVVGQAAMVRKTFRQSDFDRFAALSGDDNPIHVDPDFAARTRFGRTVAHGMLLYSCVCGVLGSFLPEPGALQIEQDLMFPTATPCDEGVEIRVELLELVPRDGWASIRTLVIRPDGSPGLQGHACVRLPGAPMVFRASAPDPAPRALSVNDFKGLRIGQRAVTGRVFTTTDIAEYADLAGDSNPLFSDVCFARQHGLSGPLVPHGLLGGLFSYLLGTHLPGRGTNYLKQRLCFPSPAYLDEPLTASVEIIRIRPEKQLVNLSTACTGAAGNLVCHGEALVLVRDVGHAG